MYPDFSDARGVYSGFRNRKGKPHGIGKVVFTEEARRGELLFSPYNNGRPCGPYLSIYANGSKRIGIFNKNGCRSGSAVYEAPTGIQYLETWVSDVGVDGAGDSVSVKSVIEEWKGAVLDAGFKIIDDWVIDIDFVGIVLAGYALAGQDVCEDLYVATQARLQWFDDCRKMQQISSKLKKETEKRAEAKARIRVLELSLQDEIARNQDISRQLQQLSVSNNDMIDQSAEAERVCSV